MAANSMRMIASLGRSLVRRLLPGRIDGFTLAQRPRAMAKSGA